MLHALDESLEQFLMSEFPSEVLKHLGLGDDVNLTVNCETPYGGVNNGARNDPEHYEVVINLFLYDVQENLDLRNKNWTTERQNGGTAVKKRLPPRVDCSYLITVWIEDEHAAAEHQVLGEVMKILLRYPTIPEAYISQELQQQELPLRLISLRPSGLQSFGEFWQAMGGKEGTKPKVILHCTVTISVPLDEAGEEVGLVGVYQPSTL